MGCWILFVDPLFSLDREGERKIRLCNLVDVIVFSKRQQSVRNVLDTTKRIKSS